MAIHAGGRAGGELDLYQSRQAGGQAVVLVRSVGRSGLIFRLSQLSTSSRCDVASVGRPVGRLKRGKQTDRQAGRQSSAIEENKRLAEISDRRGQKRRRRGISSR